jgi:hypothetical protein
MEKAVERKTFGLKNIQAPFMIKTIFALSLIALLITACATVAHIKQTEMFERTTEAYSKAIRWSDFEAANRYRYATQKQNNPPDIDALNQIKVTSYEVKEVAISKEVTHVRQIVEIGYYKIDSIIEKSLRDHQIWIYDPVDKRWYLHSKLPDFE